MDNIVDECYRVLDEISVELRARASQHMDDVVQPLPAFTEADGQWTMDGEVKDGIDLAGRLVKSDRVRQSIIRYAFRYFMGRNEFLSDSKTLIDAEQAYLKSEGSFDAVIVSLLTSDSFLYRKSLSQNISHE